MQRIHARWRTSPVRLGQMEIGRKMVKHTLSLLPLLIFQLFSSLLFSFLHHHQLKGFSQMREGRWDDELEPWLGRGGEDVPLLNREVGW